MKKILLTMAFLAPAVMFAAETPDTCDVKDKGHFHLMKTTPELTDILSRNRHNERHYHSTPKYILANPSNYDFMLTIGGQLNVILGGDIGNNLYHQSSAGISFTTSAIPVPAQKGKKGDFYINPIDGFIDFQMVGLANTENEVSGYIKIGTNGVTTSLALQRAYLTWRGLTGGLKLTMFQDDYACQPPTIDPEGPSGCISAAVYELSYKSKSYNGFRFAAGLDVPTYNTALGYYRGHDFPALEGEQVTTTDYEQIIPDVPVWVEYSWSKWNRIRVSGILRNFIYKDNLQDKTRYSQGWGVMLSGNVQPASKWILYYQFAYGQGIGSYLQDIAGHPYSFTPKNSDPGRMQANPMMGANIGVSFNPTSKLQFNAMFSESRIWNVADYANSLDESENYKYALYGAVNCFYNINPFLQLGVEYLWGHRETWNIGGAHDSRLQAQLQFNF